MNRATDGVKLMLRLIAEKVLRLPMHARLRPVLLRALGARIGRNVRIDEVMFMNLSVGFSNLAIGDHSYIGAGTIVDLIGRVEIGSHVGIGAGCVLVTHFNPEGVPGNRLAALYPKKVTGIRIGDHTIIGANTTILEGVTIGDLTLIGAGALVTRDIPSQVLAYGVPARMARELTDIPE